MYHQKSFFLFFFLFFVLQDLRMIKDRATCHRQGWGGGSAEGKDLLKTQDEVIVGPCKLKHASRDKAKDTKLIEIVNTGSAPPEAQSHVQARK